MSLEDIVKASRAAKDASKPAAGGKTKKERGGGRDAPYAKKDKKEPAPKKEKKERPPKDTEPPPPAKSLFVGNLPWTIEAAAVEAHLGTVASCSVEIRMRRAKAGQDPKPAGFAIASFEDIDSATKVLEALADSELEGRKLLLRYDRVVPPAASSE